MWLRLDEMERKRGRQLMGNVDGAEETGNKNQTRDTHGVVNERE